MEEIETRFCRTIDRPPLFLWWEVDEVGVFGVCLVLSLLIFHQATHGAIAGATAMWLYIKFFKQKGRANKILHYLWRKGLIHYQSLPPGYADYFWE